MDSRYSKLLAIYCFLKSSNKDMAKYYLSLCYHTFIYGGLEKENTNWINRSYFEKIKKENETIDEEMTWTSAMKSDDIDAEYQLGQMYSHRGAWSGKMLQWDKILHGKELICSAIKRGQTYASIARTAGLDDGWGNIKDEIRRSERLKDLFLSHEERFEANRQAYLNGCTYAGLNLGLVRNYCTLFFMDLPVAFDWYTELANAGNMYAQYVLARYFLEKKAFNEYDEWLLRAAENGYAEAQYALGNKFKGRDNNKSIYWLIKAAKQGHIKAAWELGVSYYNEYCRELHYLMKTEKYGKGQKYLIIAAERGDSQAIHDLRRYCFMTVQPINWSKVYLKEQLDVDLENIEVSL